MAALKMTTQKNTSTPNKDSSDVSKSKNEHDDRSNKKKNRDGDKPESLGQEDQKTRLSKGQTTLKKPVSPRTKETTSTRSRPTKPRSTEKYFGTSVKEGSSFRSRGRQKNSAQDSQLPRRSDPFRRMPKEHDSVDLKKSTDQTLSPSEKPPAKRESALEKFLKPNKKNLKKDAGVPLKGNVERKTSARGKATRSPGPETTRRAKSNATNVNVTVNKGTTERAALSRTTSKLPITNRIDARGTPLPRPRVRQKPNLSHVGEAPLDQGQGMRVQKWISMQGVASRREAEQWIDEGKVFVNGKLVTEQGLRIDPQVDKVTVLGRHISDVPPPRVYWLLNKPDMVLTSRPDGTGRLSIYDLYSTRDLQFLVSPVGRLDFRTEGLLLLSNDGELVHRLAHPKYKVPRYYNVLIDGRLSHEEESFIRRGIELEDGLTGKTELIFAHSVNLGQSRGSWYFITVYEGRNRLVRRLFEYFGFKVVRLVRYGFGDLRLPDDLPAGQYRQLTPSEIKYLKETVQLSGD